MSFDPRQSAAPRAASQSLSESGKTSLFSPTRRILRYVKVFKAFNLCLGSHIACREGMRRWIEKAIDLDQNQPLLYRDLAAVYGQLGRARDAEVARDRAQLLSFRSRSRMCRRNSSEPPSRSNAREYSSSASWRRPMRENASPLSKCRREETPILSLARCREERIADNSGQIIKDEGVRDCIQVQGERDKSYGEHSIQPGPLHGVSVDARRSGFPVHSLMPWDLPRFDQRWSGHVRHYPVM